LVHQNGYFGTTNCHKEKAVHALEQTSVSGKCIKMPGMGAMYTCTPGPCDEGTNSDNVAQMVLDVHRQRALALQFAL